MSRWVDEYGDLVGVVLVSIAVIAIVALVVSGFVQPRGQAIDVWNEVVVDKQYEGARSGTGVGVTGGGQVGAVFTHTSAKYHIITERDIYSVGRNYFLRVSVGDSVQIGSFRTMFGRVVVGPIKLEAER